MNGQFKQESFDRIKLSRFAGLLAQHGFDVSVQWRTGAKKVDASNENANSFELKYKEKLLFKQNKTTGFANMSQLDTSEKAIFLQELKAHHFYTKPTWTLGIGLVILYASLILFAALVKSGTVGGILLVLMVSTLILLAATYFWAVEKIPEKVYPYFFFFGLGYIGTSPSSLLALPLFMQCLRLRLYRQVTEAEYIMDGAVAED